MTGADSHRPEPPPGFLDRGRVQALLSELAEAMAGDGVTAKIVVVGGGALCFVYDRQATVDIDAAVYPPHAAARHTAEIARRHDLRPDWLNEAAAGFLPHDEPGTIPIVVRGGVEVERVDTDVLLAMKLRACRPRKDLFDLAFLLRHNDVRSVAEAEAWLDRYFPEETLRTPEVVETALGEITLPTSPPTVLEAVSPRDVPAAVCRQWIVREDARCVLPAGHEGNHSRRG